MIYTAFPHSEPLGWMSSSAPECLLSENDQFLIEILAALPQEDSQYTLNRKNLKWLYHWCGAYECVTTFNEVKYKQKYQNFQSRLQFLLCLWSENFFKPFDTIESSIEYLNNFPKIPFVVRLSSTKPGYITVTRKNGKAFTHTRYQLCANSCMIINNLKIELSSSA